MGCFALMVLCAVETLESNLHDLCACIYLCTGMSGLLKGSLSVWDEDTRTDGRVA